LVLHDPDREVQRLCEKALRGRGLTSRHIRLARLLTDANPTARLQMFFYLNDDSDLDIVRWLSLLSHDPAESVRLAAVRAAAEQDVSDLRERLEQMAATDPSPTVCQLAGYYAALLRHRQVQNSTSR